MYRDTIAELIRLQAALDKAGLLMAALYLQHAIEEIEQKLRSGQRNGDATTVN